MQQNFFSVNMYLFIFFVSANLNLNWRFQSEEKKFIHRSADALPFSWIDFKVSVFIRLTSKHLTIYCSFIVDIHFDKAFYDFIIISSILVKNKIGPRQIKGIHFKSNSDIARAFKFNWIRTQMDYAGRRHPYFKEMFSQITNQNFTSDRNHINLLKYK